MDNISEDQQNVINMILHPDILEKIIKFIPPQKRGNVALTSKIFYETVCHLEKHRYPLSLNLEEEETYSGILLSKRKFTDAFIILKPKKMHIDFKKIQKVLEVHGKTIDFMEIGYKMHLKKVTVELEASSWISLFEQLPNLKTLHFFGNIELTIVNWPKVIPVFEKLEDFNYNITKSSLGHEFLQMFLTDKIETLYVHHFWDQLYQLLQRQSQIKNLSLAFECFKERNFLDNNKLNTLRIIGMENWHENMIHTTRDNIYNIIAHQSALSELSFPRIEDSPISFTPRAIGILSHLKNLMSLTTGPLQQSTMRSIHEIANYTSLKELNIDIRNLESEDLIQLTSIRMDNLKKVTFSDDEQSLNLRDSPLDNVLICENIKINWPNITHLDVCSGLNFLNAFLDIQQLESLEIKSQREVNEESEEKEPLYFNSNTQQYPNLKKLVIPNVKITYIQELFTALPNLEVLSLAFISCHHLFEEFESILYYSPHLVYCLQKMKEIKELNVVFSTKFIRLTVEDAKLIVNLCSKLREFYIVFVPNENTDNSEFINQLELSDDFIHVIISQSGDDPDDRLITLKNVDWN